MRDGGEYFTVEGALGASPDRMKLAALGNLVDYQQYSRNLKLARHLHRQAGTFEVLRVFAQCYDQRVSGAQYQQGFFIQPRMRVDEDGPQPEQPPNLVEALREPLCVVTF